MKKQIFYVTLMLFCWMIADKTISAASAKVQNHNLKIEIFPDKHLAIMEDNLRFSGLASDSVITLFISKQAHIDSIKDSSGSLPFEVQTEFDAKTVLADPQAETGDYENASLLRIHFPQPLSEGQLTLKYKLFAGDSVEKAAFSREYIAYQVSGYIGKKGIFLSPAYFWYPSGSEELSRFQLQVSMPDTLHIISQGKLTQDTVQDGIRSMEWIADYPTDGIHLVGSRYEIQSVKQKDTDIYTYFFPESQELSDSYLSASQRYLEMYENLIGEYPFSKFAVVENFFPTGYGMPSYTLLGSHVIRLPFIIYTSLGHEITHNWWGNSVYVDYEKGNWCEGLTTYFADYHYKEMQSAEAARDYRRDLLRDFTVYVKDEKDIPLSEFKERTESASRAVGYAKSAMVFHQIRQIVGDDIFYRAFREFYRQNKFKKAAWADIEKSMESVSKKDYTWFFKQWVNRKSAPKINLDNVSYRNGKIYFRLSQDPPAWRLYMPVKITFADTTQRIQVWFNTPSQTYQIPVKQDPKSIAVDPDFDIMRKLDRAEIPPTLSEMFAAKDAVIVLPDECSPEKAGSYRTFAQTLSENLDSLEIKTVSELNATEMESSSLYLLGMPSENSLFEKLPIQFPDEVTTSNGALVLKEKQQFDPDDVCVLVFRDEQNPNRNIAAVEIGDNGQTGRIGVLLPHYGKYSYLVFNQGQNSVKGNYSGSKSPLTRRFGE